MSCIASTYALSWESTICSRTCQPWEGRGWSLRMHSRALIGEAVIRSRTPICPASNSGELPALAARPLAAPAGVALLVASAVRAETPWKVASSVSIAPG